MKPKLIILFALTALSTMTFAQTKESAQIQKAQNYKYQWEVKIHFSLPALNPEAIQIGLLEFDPTEKFLQKFNRLFVTE